MPTDAKTGLFGTLPEQMAAARPVGVPRLRQAERRQVSLRPISLEDLLPPDHRARFVWAFAERLDLTALYRAIKAVESHPGLALLSNFGPGVLTDFGPPAVPQPRVSWSDRGAWHGQ